MEDQKWKKVCNLEGNFPGRCVGNGDEQCKRDLTEDGNNPSKCRCRFRAGRRHCRCIYCEVFGM
ncbi:unnamed protein product [Arabidopsis lyrata]|nr:unnamed protein product [Arabidopsis lyrata]